MDTMAEKSEVMDLPSTPQYTRSQAEDTDWDLDFTKMPRRRKPRKSNKVATEVQETAASNIDSEEPLSYHEVKQNKNNNWVICMWFTQ